MSDLPPTTLGGEADPNAWYFNRVGEEGPLPNPVGHTFPLITHDASERWRIVGTGFYVNDSGMFATARHVIEDVMQNGHQISPLVILHLHSNLGLFGPSEVLFRPIAQCWLGETADVALGYAASATNSSTGEQLKNWCWTLSWRVPNIGAVAATYAFPNSAVSADGRRIRLSPNAYMGRVQAFGDHRDRVMLPFPFIQVDFRIHGAASGGPTLSGGDVIGINCTEYPENVDHPPGPGFCAQARCLSDAFFDDFVLPNETSPRLVTFDECVRTGVVKVRDYAPPPAGAPRRGTLVRPHMEYVAPRPAVDIEVWA